MSDTTTNAPACESARLQPLPPTPFPSYTTLGAWVEGEVDYAVTSREESIDTERLDHGSSDLKSLDPTNPATLYWILDDIYDKFEDAKNNGENVPREVLQGMRKIREWFIVVGAYRAVKPGEDLGESWSSRTGRMRKVKPDFRIDGIAYVWERHPFGASNID